MFQLTPDEAQNLRFQIGTSSSGYGGRRYLPYVFTEQGIAMLSSALNSERAIQVNIVIMRVFVKIREMIATHHDLARKLEDLERKYEAHDVEIQAIFDSDPETPEAIQNKVTTPRVSYRGEKAILGWNRNPALENSSPLGKNPFPSSVGVLTFQASWFNPFRLCYNVYI